MRNTAPQNYATFPEISRKNIIFERFFIIISLYEAYAAPLPVP